MKVEDISVQKSAKKMLLTTLKQYNVKMPFKVKKELTESPSKGKNIFLDSFN